jgi:uncharacterized membrane protein
MKFFSKQEEDQIVAAIQAAESKTSGEIRVHLLRRIKKTIYEDAISAFEKLRMTRTERRNGILIVLAPKKHEFAVIGDTGIHEKVTSHFWDKVRKDMQNEFKTGDFLKGILNGVQTCGQELERYFPRTKQDKNELSDQVS